MKVLVAEDEVISRRALEKSIADWGYSVQVSQNGEEAWNEIIKTLHTSKPSPEDIRLAVLDWEMPGINGVELCRRVRRESINPNPKYIYIILLTGKDSQDEILAGLATGADDYMTKPFDPDELKIRLRNGEMKIHREDEINHRDDKDPQTELWSRKRIIRILEAELSRGIRSGHPTGVLYLDMVCISHTDLEFGQYILDKQMANLARNVKAELRRYDHIGRFTPSGLLVVLPGCGREHVLRIGNWILECADNLPLVEETANMIFQVSIGGISAENDITPAACLRSCAQALQLTKKDAKSPNIIILPSCSMETHSPVIKG